MTNIDTQLPHPIHVEVEARRIIERGYAYRIIDPMKLDAAYRVVERNRRARAPESPKAIYDLPIFGWAWREDARDLRA